MKEDKYGNKLEDKWDKAASIWQVFYIGALVIGVVIVCMGIAGVNITSIMNYWSIGTGSILYSAMILIFLVLVVGLIVYGYERYAHYQEFHTERGRMINEALAMKALQDYKNGITSESPSENKQQKRKLIALIPTAGRSPEEIHKDIDETLKTKMPELYQKKGENDDKANS